MISTQDAFGEALRVKSQEPSVLMETSNLSLITDDSSLIEELLQTIESLDSTMREMREEISFLRDRLSKMDASLEEKELEQKRLWALIEAKDNDNKRMGQQMAELLGKVAALTKALEE